MFDIRLNRRIARIALFAMLLQFLLPVAHALAPQDDVPGRTAVCTAAGLKWIDAEGEPLPPTSADVKHCPLCALFDDEHVVLAPVVAPFRLPETGGDEPHPEAGQPPVPFSISSPPPSRGPPLNA